ncbi:MAG: CAP domain-containing protein [Planctomycetota bacterium]|nr:CAP domain-containing protein [Planctomycetota bacterium]
MPKPSGIFLILGCILALAPPLRADLLILKDGSEVTGTVTESNDESIVILTPNGARTISRDAIQEILREDDLRRVYRKKLTDTRLSDPEAQFDLAEWLQAVGLRDEASARWSAVLSLDPDHAGARARLGYVRKKDQWVLEGEVRRKKKKGKTQRLPADVAAIASLTLSESAWERSLAYRRLNGILKAERERQIDALQDPATTEDVDEQIRRTLVSPLESFLSKEMFDIARKLEGDYRKVRSLIPTLSSKRVSSRRDRLMSQVREVRKSALEAIYDTESYHKSAQGVVTGQRWVDEKVQGLKEVWLELDKQISSDLSRLLELSTDGAAEWLGLITRRVDQFSELQSFIKALQGFAGVDSMTTPPQGTLCLLFYRAGKIGIARDMQEEGIPEWEEVLLERLKNLRILEANESLANTEPGSGLAPNPRELRQSMILNEYRMMLGRGALEINANLTACAHGHSEEMSRLGYFGHDSPIPERKTPSMRAKLAGYNGSVSENIHMSGGASPEGAHDGWYHSPPHHRNMVSDAWFCIGVGQHGAHFTQNFGTLKKIKS